ncbi:hypothetical protein [Legionella shakespearei]|uniref:Uncharacterized protein n=1 Tax=Legionella shakespearei DSM 23087 TaxID=1122169 RepID=A0A0W0YQV6_9GAMM|nr:hypothetical protein [Legionella shakespearei]KTD59289.1 hypothetical protein Lsha_1985 [Legionella shakespearei DSM 23087]
MPKKNKNKEQIENKGIEVKEKAANTTKLYLHCRGHATMALSKLHGDGFDAVEAFERLSRSVERIHNNDTNEIEAMLITQAKSLDYLFYNALSKLSSSNIEHAEIFSGIALKAQSGCRKTLMALAELKHPRRTTIIKQQNNAITQQVNNGVKSQSGEIENNKKFANELNGEVLYETKNLDVGATIATGTADKAAEALEVLNRS